MGQRMFHVKVDSEILEFPDGTTFRQIAEVFQKNYPHDIVGVFVNDKLEELHKKLKTDCVIRFVTTADNIGHKTYERSMCLMLVKAIYDVAEHENVEKVRIHYSLSKGLYCTIDGNIELNQEFLDKVTIRMQDMVAMDMLIGKSTINTDDAIALFRQHGMYDKEKLFKYRRVSKVNVYNMNEFEDYFYGHMVPSAGYLKYFKLYLYDEGFVIQMPEKSAPEIVPEFKPQHKLFQVLRNQPDGEICRESKRSEI